MGVSLGITLRRYPVQTKKILKYPTLQLTASQKKTYTLMEIEKLMRQSGRSLREYPEIQLPSTDNIELLGNRLINEELNYDSDNLRSEHLTIVNNLNPEQKKSI